VSTFITCSRGRRVPPKSTRRTRAASNRSPLEVVPRFGSRATATRRTAPSSVCRPTHQCAGDRIAQPCSLGPPDEPREGFEAGKFRSIAAGAPARRSGLVADLLSRQSVQSTTSTDRADCQRQPSVRRRGSYAKLRGTPTVPLDRRLVEIGRGVAPNVPSRRPVGGRSQSFVSGPRATAPPLTLPEKPAVAPKEDARTIEERNARPKRRAARFREKVAPVSAIGVQWRPSQVPGALDAPAARATKGTGRLRTEHAGSRGTVVRRSAGFRPARSVAGRSERECALGPQVGAVPLTGRAVGQARRAKEIVPVGLTSICAGRLICWMNRVGPGVVEAGVTLSPRGGPRRVAPAPERPDQRGRAGGFAPRRAEERPRRRVRYDVGSVSTWTFNLPGLDDDEPLLRKRPLARQSERRGSAACWTPFVQDGTKNVRSGAGRPRGRRAPRTLSTEACCTEVDVGKNGRSRCSARNRDRREAVVGRGKTVVRGGEGAARKRDVPKTGRGSRPRTSGQAHHWGSQGFQRSTQHDVDGEASTGTRRGVWTPPGVLLGKWLVMVEVVASSGEHRENVGRPLGSSVGA